ncbi:SDR family oxidoreductase [Neomegalonema sp.]|uniref:SDR family oxidoreductase n=1 Tax=Neomegalonema sp. TaxID=2039713 RepID=UPI0026212E08|nr:SDR family oxidoreductase [Neomegalonema sp.]MDD2867242.1 SDR family oxidoreductase [Neomegalonema sp.]
MKRMVFFGYGYSAAALRRRLEPAGWRFLATARTPGKQAQAEAEGVEAQLWETADLDGMLGEGAAVLVSAAPGAGGVDPVLARWGEALGRRAARVGWLGYLSTTSVYGDWGGQWVDEDSELRAVSARGLARVAAEEAWLDLGARTGLPVHVFRLSGIYGPGRGPFEKLRSGRSLTAVKPGQVFGRIHADDIALALSASLLKPRPGRVYNVTDDHPCPPEEAMAAAARLLGRAPPPEVPVEEAGLTEMGREFYADNKRVSNARIRRELGISWAYPTYREGFAAILAREPAMGRLL